jgi:exodeoxyribonuclease V gamma subunit
VNDRSFAAPDDPLVTLRDLVAIYDAGRREPLPLPLKTSYAWANARWSERDPRDAADKEWSNDYGAKEQDEPAHVRVWREFAPLSVLLGPPRAGEEFDGEHTRLGALAMRLWRPLFVAERP